MPKYLHPTGSYVRKEAKLNDLDFLTTKDLDIVVKDFPLFIAKILKQGDKYLSIKLTNGLKIDIWRIDEGTLNTEKLSRDYEKGLVIGMRKKANTLGYILNNHGLYKNNVVVSNDVKDIFKILNIEYRKP
jgi:DNA polymerase/3'-5' exonuclease PolX